jgi:hypothetical protein
MPIPKGFKHSEETKLKISEAKKGNKNLLGYKHTDATKLKISLGNKGKIVTEETKKKLSLNHKGMQGKVLSDEAKLKISQASKGRKHSEESKLKISLANTGRIISDETKQKISNTLKGTHISDETKLKMSLAMKGENHPNWQGGISFFPYPTEWNEELRELIRTRDNYTCKICGLKQENLIGMHQKLPVHHIDYNKDNLNPSNLISLCLPCHSKTNYYRDKWYEYFQILIQAL